MNEIKQAGKAAADFPAGGGAVVILVITALFVLSQLYAAIALLAPVSAGLGGDATFALATSFSLTYALGFLIWGPVSDHFGRKRVMVIAVGVLALSTLLCALSSSLAMMTVLRALQGLAAAGFAPVALAYLTEAVPPARRGAAIGAMSTAFLLAGIFGQVLASSVTLQLGWTWFFVLCAAVLALMFALMAGFLREVERHAPSMSLWQQFGNLARLFTKTPILLLTTAHLTLLLSFVALYTGIGHHLAHLEVSVSQVILIRLSALPAMFVCLTVGMLARRIGMLRAAQSGFALAAVGMLGEVLFSGTLGGVIAASIVYVAGVALAVPSMINLYAETAAPNRGSGMAINGFVLFVGASIGPIVGAAIGDFRALTATLTALLLIAVLALGSLLMYQRKNAKA